MLDFFKIIGSETNFNVKEMGTYIDGFVLVVPKGKEEDYKKMSEES